MDHTFEVELEQCCIQALEEIRDKKELGRVGATLSISPLAALTSDGPLQTALQLTNQDWDAWSRAIQSVSTDTRNRCHQIAALHHLDHQDGPKAQFWREMEDSFQGYGR